VSRWQWISGDGSTDDYQRKKTVSNMAKMMKKLQIPQTDSIEELASFWDTHDLADFEDQLEEVSEQVFVRGAEVTIRLLPEEMEAVRRMAESKGVPDSDLLYQWVREKLQVAL
jgi:predicted DNA binding CopG/RHH family protein